jgi:uncharacterized Zn-finger protein
MTATQSNSQIPANTRLQYVVTRADLPLSCPARDMTLWNSHPRVYLFIEKTGRARCPYCEAEYFLSEASRISE